MKLKLDVILVIEGEVDALETFARVVDKRVFAFEFCFKFIKFKCVSVM